MANRVAEDASPEMIIAILLPHLRPQKELFSMGRFLSAGGGVIEPRNGSKGPLNRIFCCILEGRLREAPFRNAHNDPKRTKEEPKFKDENARGTFVRSAEEALFYVKLIWTNSPRLGWAAAQRERGKEGALNA